jgi:hypothetical protein
MYVQSTSLMSRANIPVVATENPRVLSEYIHRLHVILVAQLMLVISFVIPFTYIPAWSAFACTYPWIGVAPTTMLAVVFMLIPEARMVYPGNWIGLCISSLCEALAIGIVAGAANNSIVLVSLCMVLFGCLGYVLRHPIRTCTMRKETRGVAWSPAILIGVGWVLSLMAAPLLCLTLSVHDATITINVLLWSESLALTFLIYVVAQTYLSTQWFCAPEFVTGSFSMFFGVLSLVVLMLWFISDFMKVVGFVSSSIGNGGFIVDTDMLLDPYTLCAGADSAEVPSSRRPKAHSEPIGGCGLDVIHENMSFG